MSEAIKEFIIEAIKSVENRDDILALKREISKKYKLNSLSNTDILREYKLMSSAGEIDESPELLQLLRRRSVRTLSGVAPIAVLTEPYPCPGNCAYCPRQEDVPVSYLANEPAVMRAIRCNYQPYAQVVSRLRALEDNGHNPSKIELIVMGGTWSYFPEEYKYWYILSCFKAANDYRSDLKKLPSRSVPRDLSLKKIKEELKKEQKKNEKALYRIIGLTLETRPDYIDEEEVKQMRDLGCTRVELGVQAIDDDILELNQRGHGVREIALATALLRRYGFKVTYHFMPALPSSNPKKDLEMYKQMFSDPRFQPDQIKFYPTVVVAGSLLYKWYQQGKYKPYSDKQLRDLIIKCKAITPEYVRIIRLVRDIPASSIIAGNKITNLRQIMQQEGISCNCIRCREAKEKTSDDYKVNITQYPAADGQEYFISIDSADHKLLLGFCRLRLDKNSPIAPALVRELHVYGELKALGSKGKVQHRGFGRMLLAKAEEIAQENGANKIAVISGVGVRGYYRKFGYRLQGNYLVKGLK